MKRSLLAILSILLAVSVSSAQKKTDKSSSTTSLKSQKDKVSYVVGYDLGSKIGADIKKQELDFAVDAFIRGIREAISGTKAALPDSEMTSAMMAFQQSMMEKQQKAQKAVAEKNLAEGNAFLAANAKKDSVKVLPSGLQYKVLAEGAGAQPAANDTVVTHYRGTLLDGKVFDESYARGEPITFPVSGVIKGWTEALQLMKVGSKWELYIPAALAYGERGAGQMIGPNSTLIFTVELLEVKKGPMEKPLTAPQDTVKSPVEKN
ncbi:MAG TPA: FKBP-type peptidyl-prolyl cis-trans isomerase [Bacteroidota bacterium]|nr:FKBP-type peptidyl-prolyl cis-trans isomerase [Bacteroidota bacterium]